MRKTVYLSEKTVRALRGLDYVNVSQIVNAALQAVSLAASNGSPVALTFRIIEHQTFDVQVTSSSEPEDIPTRRFTIQ